ncbi:hypothetical protein DFAR_2920005 [Desulfarculales bacterium]
MLSAILPPMIDPDMKSSRCTALAHHHFRQCDAHFCAPPAGSFFPRSRWRGPSRSAP